MCESHLVPGKALITVGHDHRSCLCFTPKQLAIKKNMRINLIRNLKPLLQSIPALLLATYLAGGQEVKADDFELAMVIKSTTNPYYNATLKGAQIAAKEIGGSAKNY